MSTIAIALTVINATAWLLPDDATDKFGRGLPARLTTPAPPYLTDEFVWECRLEVLLINRTRDAREIVLRRTKKRPTGY